ncbi:MAG: hypothetical protein QXI32_03025 [Candidatus Bathyarchaeia archaeon]
MKSNSSMTKHIFPAIVILMILALLFVYLVFAVGPLAFVLRPFWRFREYVGGPSRIPLDIELFYAIKTVLTTVNATLATLLMAIYLGIYRKTKSEFTIGLIIFSTVLLLYAITSNPLVQLIFGFRAYGLGPFAMLPDLFACAALSVLVYLSLRY